MTKIAVLTDVHGNAPALRAVLEQIDREGNTERIFCLGDMVGIGPDTNEVLELLFSRNDVSMVSGNHEDAVLALLSGQDPESKGEEREHHEWIASHMDAVYQRMLKALPRSIEIHCDGTSLLMQHYHLDACGRFLQIDANPTVQTLDSLYEDHPVQAVCFGHHHPIHHFRSEKRLYLNPGSLGCCHRPVARYAVLQIHAGEIDIQLREEAYDRSTFLASYEELGVPAREFILRIFHGYTGA